MSNIAQDSMSWIWLAKVAVTLCLLGFSGYHFYQGMRAIDQKPAVAKRQFIKAGVAVSLTLVAILALFVFFGPGSPTVVTPATEDGYAKMVRARPDSPPESRIEEEAKAGRDPYLKAVDESPAAAQKESKEYVDKAIERSKNRAERGDVK